MANVYDKLKEMNLTLPTPPAKGGLYTPVMEFGDHLLYCSGLRPADQRHQHRRQARQGSDRGAGPGSSRCAACSTCWPIWTPSSATSNRIKRFVKVLAFVNSADDFTQQPQVVNGGSQLLLDLFGEERGLPARTAMGVNATPATSPWKSSCWPSTNKRPEAVHHQLKKERSA